MTKNLIDFIIPWVDGSDPEWRERKNKYLGVQISDDSEQRYRDWGLLPYWFRGVEKFAPWVRKIWFICDQEPPAWLNREHPKLAIVRHEDYLPEEYRPAFSSHPIELNFHRIKGLSNKFVYFNDDMFLLRPVEPSFFFRRGLPCDSALLNTIPTDDLVKDPEGRVFTIFLNNTSYVNREYDFRACFRKNFNKWIHPCYGKDNLRNLMLCIWPRLVGTVESHLPESYLKTEFEEAWAKNFDILDRTSRHHIRHDQDVNQWFIRMRRMMEGHFVPVKPVRGAVYSIGRDREEVLNAICKQKHPMICLNDGASDDDYEMLRSEILDAFSMLLPSVSSFEKY